MRLLAVNSYYLGLSMPKPKRVCIFCGPGCGRLTKEDVWPRVGLKPPWWVLCLFTRVGEEARLLGSRLRLASGGNNLSHER
jgi:hypothetical protein